MAIAEELTAGIISSVLAVLLVEIYLWLRRRYRHRALRWLVGADTVSVSTPVYPRAQNAHPAGLLTTYDAIGLAHVLEACNRIGTMPVVTRSGESSENSPLDVVAIGGPSGNQVTATFLKAYCPGFEILTDPESGELSYRCGDRVFVRTEDETFAFIVRLSPKETGLPGTALIAWGHSAVATASAGYFLARYPQTLRKVGKGSFFVAISVRWVLGYRSFDTRPIDLTRAAFAPPVGGSSGAPPVAVASVQSGTALDADADAGSASGPGATSGPAPEEQVDEAPPRRRFGRSGRSTPAARSSATGRSRVAEALDDVRAESTAVVMAPAPEPLTSAGSSVGTSSIGVSPSEEAPSEEAPAKRPAPRIPPSVDASAQSVPSSSAGPDAPDRPKSRKPK